MVHTQTKPVLGLKGGHPRGEAECGLQERCEVKQAGKKFQGRSLDASSRTRVGGHLMRTLPVLLG